MCLKEIGGRYKKYLGSDATLAGCLVIFRQLSTGVWRLVSGADFLSKGLRECPQSWFVSAGAEAIGIVSKALRDILHSSKNN